jgi:hypothetical protein
MTIKDQEKLSQKVFFWMTGIACVGTAALCGYFVWSGIMSGDPAYFQAAQQMENRREASRRCEAERLNDVYLRIAGAAATPIVKNPDCEAAATASR